MSGIVSLGPAAARRVAAIARRVGVGKRRGYLLGLLVVAPIAFWLSSAETWAGYAKRERLWSIAVPRGATIEYAGAGWRLAGVEVEERLATGAGRSIALPAGLSLVRVRLEMTARSAESLPTLASCQGTLRDAQGRRWDAEPSEIARRAKRLPSNCSSWLNPAVKKIEPARAGQPWQFELAYLVPKEIAAEATPEITLRRELPRYLRFQR